MASSQQDLAALIERYKGGRSYQKLSDDSGGRVSPQRLWQLAKIGAGSTDTLPLQNRDIVEGLAATLGVRPWTVIEAMAVTMGWDPSRSDAPLLARMPAGVENLPHDFVEGTIATIRAAVAMTVN
jgi:hypothetical protein